MDRDGSVFISQAEFSRTIKASAISAERLRSSDRFLRPHERAEFKSVCGSVLHLAGHTRADLSAA
eukprot:3316029-Lingulodinium_polyedra.AAC.1